MTDLPNEANEADALEQLESAGDATKAVEDPEAAGAAADWDAGDPVPEDERGR